MFTATCFDSKESSSGCVTTIYVYNETVHILGSLKAYNVVKNVNLNVIQLKVAIYKKLNVIH